MSKSREPLLNQDASDPSDDNRAAPEHRLWLAVIERYVSDFRELFDKISNQIRYESTYNLFHFHEYKKLERDLNRQDFRDICDYANFSYDRVLRLFYIEARASGLFDYRPSEQVLTPTNARRARGWH